ncbi:hypothetical protein MPH_08095 [Macrophomina phaseolina MS6]|uniref:Uncharacterized protein n=1 Tax=Macrophomina phaseolina (strain MS6) TaxID=1126212 RepID=K2SD91_MACPH|nr:hypothetical protein MPH_08095 [Macrophomina phaseolina MS6]
MRSKDTTLQKFVHACPALSTTSIVKSLTKKYKHVLHCLARAGRKMRGHGGGISLNLRACWARLEGCEVTQYACLRLLTLLCPTFFFFSRHVAGFPGLRSEVIVKGIRESDTTCPACYTSLEALIVQKQGNSTPQKSNQPFSISVACLEWNLCNKQS